jgi:catechol 2,3-dioxygenase
MTAAHDTTSPAAATVPLAVDRVALTVNDLHGVSDFYQRVVGLRLLRQDGEVALLGAGEAVLLELRHDGAARRRAPREAGLFHTAFLLPARADLGRWLRQSVASAAPLAGAADHGVSEAVYLSDPEGNGIEIYADRPASAWKWRQGLVEMPSDPLDIDSLIGSTGAAAWQGVPEGAVVGHVHLQVGAIAPADAFWSGVVGLDVTCRYSGGTFYAADGYHHHIATNIWNSRGAGERRYPSTGLAEVVLRMDAARRAAVRQRADAPATGTLTLRDPWGTAITLRDADPHPDASGK